MRASFHPSFHPSFHRPTRRVAFGLAALGAAAWSLAPQAARAVPPSLVAISPGSLVNTSFSGAGNVNYDPFGGTSFNDDFVGQSTQATDNSPYGFTGDNPSALFLGPNPSVVNLTFAPAGVGDAMTGSDTLFTNDSQGSELGLDLSGTETGDTGNVSDASGETFTFSGTATEDAGNSDGVFTGASSTLPFLITVTEFGPPVLSAAVPAGGAAAGGALRPNAPPAGSNATFTAAYGPAATPAVPEASSLWLLGAGLLGLLAARKRRA